MAVAQLEGERLALLRRSVANARDAQVDQESLGHALKLVLDGGLQPHSVLCMLCCLPVTGVRDISTRPGC